MPTDRTTLGGKQRLAVLAEVRATEPACHLCGLPIQLDRDRQRDPLGSTVDEIVPRSFGGSGWDRANARHAHRVCNGSRRYKVITPAVRARCLELATLALAREQRPTRRW
jgi:5-methylcytosine-specific restriction endonuclease McrA